MARRRPYESAEDFQERKTSTRRKNIAQWAAVITLGASALPGVHVPVVDITDAFHWPDSHSGDIQPLPNNNHPRLTQPEVLPIIPPHEQVPQPPLIDGRPK